MKVGTSKIRSAIFAAVMLVVCYPLLAATTSIQLGSTRGGLHGSGSLSTAMIFLIPIGSYYFHKMIQQVHGGGLRSGKERSLLPTEIILLTIAFVLNILLFG